MMRGAIVLAIAACRRDPIDSCDDNLRGIWDSDRGPWMILDAGNDLEVYPLFGDVPTSNVGVAPRVIDLHRTSSGLTGTLHRRYMQRDESCDARVPVRVASCVHDTLEILLVDPMPPLDFASCTWPLPARSRVERWSRRR
jgi:hypothetical protein